MNNEAGEEEDEPCACDECKYDETKSDGSDIGIDSDDGDANDRDMETTAERSERIKREVSEMVDEAGNCTNPAHCCMDITGHCDVHSGNYLPEDLCKCDRHLSEQFCCGRDVGYVCECCG